MSEILALGEPMVEFNQTGESGGLGGAFVDQYIR